MGLDIDIYNITDDDEIEFLNETYLKINKYYSRYNKYEGCHSILAKIKANRSHKKYDRLLSKLRLGLGIIRKDEALPSRKGDFYISKGARCGALEEGADFYIWLIGMDTDYEIVGFIEPKTIICNIRQAKIKKLFDESELKRLEHIENIANSMIALKKSSPYVRFFATTSF